MFGQTRAGLEQDIAAGEWAVAEERAAFEAAQNNAANYSWCCLKRHVWLRRGQPLARVLPFCRTPLLPLVGVSIAMERGRQQNDGLAYG